MRAAWSRLSDTIGTLHATPASAANEATLFLRAFGHIVVAWIWLDIGVVSAGMCDDEFARAKHRACLFFFETELPLALCWLSLVNNRSDIAATAPLSTFA
jgi:hypothetical protein